MCAAERAVFRRKALRRHCITQDGIDEGESATKRQAHDARHALFAGVNRHAQRIPGNDDRIV